MNPVIPIIKQNVKRLMFMFPAHAFVFILSWLGTGPSSISLLPFINLPIIYILVRKSPTFINIPLFTALTLGAALSHNEPSTSPMESYFDDFSILIIVGISISIITLAPMIITKFTMIKVNEKFENFTHNLNSRMIFPIIWTVMWSLFRRYSPLGSWGDWTYTIYNSGLAGDPLMQLTSFGGLSAINFILALWTQIIADFFILNHRINRATRTVIINEETPLLSEIEQPQPPNNIKVYKEDLSVNYYLRVIIIVAVLSCFFIGGERVKNIENNVNPIPYERVGCILPSHNTSAHELLQKTSTISSNLQAKIVLWSESALALRNDDELNELLEGAFSITSKYKFYLGLTYTIPTGENGHKKKNMLRFVGPNKQTLFEYQKTHPVPWVESYSTESGPGKLKVIDAEIETKSKKELHEMKISGAICLDMDFPELLGQAAGANLVLSPAQTWSAQVGLQHLRMSSVRAIENGYWILRCDGGGASGLIDPYGRVRHMQITSSDHVSIFAWDMPFEDKIDTYYSHYGESTVWGVLMILGLLELSWYFAWKVAEEDMATLTDSTKEFLLKRQEWAEEKCRFVEYMPAAINALAFTPSTTKPLIACGRANGDIEIWNPLNLHLEKRILGELNTSVEAITWVHKITLTETDKITYNTQAKQDKALKELTSKPPRLFSGSANGLITEWDTIKLSSKKFIDSHGGAIWCMAVNHANTLIAVGCDDGGIRIFEIIDDGLSLINSYDRKQAKVTSLAWDKEDKHIVFGTSDSNIIKWNVEQGRVIHRIIVEKKLQKETIIWAIQVLKDGTIVSGDSLGHVCFWEGTFGTMKQKLGAHDADVLCLASNLNGTAIYSSGIDRKCFVYRIVSQPKSYSKDNSVPNEKHWVKVGYSRHHMHDVKALAICEGRDVNSLISGGIDTTIVVAPILNFPKNKYHRLPFVPLKLMITKLPRLYQFEQKVPRLELVEPQQAILEITLKGNHQLMVGSISENGEWIAVSDIERIKLFKVLEDASHLRVRKIKDFPQVTIDGRNVGANLLGFTPDGSKLVVAFMNSEIVIFGLDIEEGGDVDVTVLERFDEYSQNPDCEPLTTLTISDDGKWLATGDLLNRISVYNLETFEHHMNIDKFSSIHTSLTFHPYKPILVITLTSNQFYLFDLQRKKLTEWSQQYSEVLPRDFLNLKDKVMGCSFNPSSDSMIIWGANYLCLVDFNKCKIEDIEELICIRCSGWQSKPKFLNKPMQLEQSDERRQEEKIDANTINFQLVTRYQTLMYLNFIEHNQLVIVERSFTSILENLPPSFYKAKYGT
ncbi:5416_t:CDS:10 [Funneliformis geosporum]|uniref:5416_t:CDS:1 n=1 Tax=Funneliformis geosporum TaxID=1117311 RepID=A0A9W4WLS0_9GLOM|nr:5416_t:CDS:10 [Funneliformis geosporum]